MRRLLPASVLAAASLLPACGTPPGSEPDTDNDGLPDSWEIENRDIGLNPDRASLIFVPVIRPNMSREEVQPTLDKVVEFFRRVPNVNPDGTTGIDVVIRWGDSLPDTDGESMHPCCDNACTATPYAEVRARGMPAALIGRAHGMLIGSCRGGGGQNGGPDWAGASNNWHTIVHELGHQLGLGHEPLGTGVPSPLYASIMNYDYNFEFNGDPNAVRFSTGMFSTISLDERNLDEALPFPLADLEFLSRHPYHYSLRPDGPASTHVDFNRNGIFGERGLHVDINGGSGLTARDRLDIEKTAGGFALVTLGDRLAVIYSDLPPPVDWQTYAEAGLTVSNPGRLRYRMLVAGDLLPARDLVAEGVTGDPHGVEAFGRVFVTFPTARGYDVHAYRPGPGAGELLITGSATERSAPSSHPTLVRTQSPEELYVFSWSESDRRLRYRRVIASPTTDAISYGPATDLSIQTAVLRDTDPFGREILRPLLVPLESLAPVGAAWNSRTSRITLVGTRSDAATDSRDRMAMYELTRDRDGWLARPRGWVAGTRHVTTRSRPTVLFDDRTPAGATGQYLIFSHYARSDADVALTELTRLSEGAPDIWTTQLMQNIWTSTRSAPAATLFRDDVAWGWRVNEIGFPDAANLLQLFLRASGITDSGLTDFDDVTWIATRGLRESLASVRP